MGAPESTPPSGFGRPLAGFVQPGGRSRRDSPGSHAPAIEWAAAGSVAIARTKDVIDIRPALLQWLRFAAVGATNTLLSWCVYAGLVRLGVHYLAASGLAFGVGAVNSYALNRRWTFRSHGRPMPEALRFGVVQGLGLGIDVCLLYVVVHGAGIPHLIAQALVFPVASAVTFLLSRHWAFATARARPESRLSAAG
jgi:putative flippase GtrA